MRGLPLFSPRQDQLPLHALQQQLPEVDYLFDMDSEQYQRFFLFARQVAQFRTVEAKLIADNRKVQDEKNALLDSFSKSGGLRLPSAKSADHSSAVSTATTSASGNQPETICYLPEEFVRDLATEAERADQIVYQLTACQMILEEERK